MKQFYTLLFLVAAINVKAQSITSVGFSWSPDELTVTAGTPITITVTSNHDMREVSQATWDANGTTSNGGFEYFAGTHTLILTVPGTYWYVCVPHVSMGMKGKIIVEASTNVAETGSNNAFTLFPNPARDVITVTSDAGQSLELSIVDVQGREVLRHALQGNDRININELPVGNYTALLLNSKGAIQTRQRLSIVR